MAGRWTRPSDAPDALVHHCWWWWCHPGTRWRRAALPGCGQSLSDPSREVEHVGQQEGVRLHDQLEAEEITEWPTFFFMTMCRGLAQGEVMVGWLLWLQPVWDAGTGFWASTWIWTARPGRHGGRLRSGCGKFRMAAHYGDCGKELCGDGVH